MVGSIDKRISLMIIGAEKAGTTALLRYLSEHPQVHAHRQREMGFFINDAEYSDGIEAAFARYYPGWMKEKSVLIGKNVGLFYSIKGLHRYKDHNPGGIVVVMLRDPVNRAYSAYWENRRKGHSPNVSFEASIFSTEGKLKEQVHLIQRSHYAPHAKNLLGLFDEAQIVTILFEEFIRDPVLICNQIFSLLGLDSLIYSESQLKPRNLGSEPRIRYIARLTYSAEHMQGMKRLLAKVFPRRFIDLIRDRIRSWNERRIEKPPLSEETRETLKTFFQESNEKMSELFDIDTAHWDHGT